jgi:hypothetical protein
MYRIGVERGFRDWIGLQSYGRIRLAIGAAITDLRHGGYGHTLSLVVESVLITSGLTEDNSILRKFGTQFPNNLRDTSLINRAIEKAAEFKWSFDPSRDVRGTAGDDIGLIDYAKLAFRLFGYQLQSLYYLYFVMLVVSTTIFILQFRSLSGIVPLVGIVSIAYVFLFSSNLFDVTSGPGAVSLTDPRVLSGLAIVPGLHIGCLVICDLPPDRASVGFAIAQAATLVFVILIRSSSIWIVLTLITLTILIAFSDYRSRTFQLMRFWSVGALLLLWTCHSAFISWTLHPVYSRGEVARHVVWHSLFYQLQVHPKWKEKYEPTFDFADGDELPRTAAKKYLLRNPPANPEEVYIAPDRNYLKYAAGETYTRKAYLELMFNDPRFVFESIFIYGSASVINVLSHYLSSLNRLPGPIFIVGVIYLLGLAWILSARASDIQILSKMALFACFAFVMSLIPNWLILAGVPQMGDQYTMLLVALTSALLLALTLTIRIAHRLLRSHHGVNRDWKANLS